MEMIELKNGRGVLKSVPRDKAEAILKFGVKVPKSDWRIVDSDKWKFEKGAIIAKAKKEKPKE